MLQRYCGNCMYWSASFFRRGPAGAAVPTEGDCRRHSPYAEGWPSTPSGGWCGEWQHLSAKDVAPQRKTLPVACRNGHRYTPGSFVYDARGSRRCLICEMERKAAPRRRSQPQPDHDINVPLPAQGRRRLRIVSGGEE